MKVTEILKNVYHVDFPSREELLKTFIRFQEYYESPMFKDKVFTLEEYSQWYMQSRGAKEFTYFQDWSGCNVPSYVFKKFSSGLFNPLREEEIQLLNALPVTQEKYYVIGTFGGGDRDVLEHELLHGLFYSNKKYKSDILELLSKYDQKKSLESVKEYILNLGYHPAVLMDEVHAYIGASYEKLGEKNISYPKSLTKEIKRLSKKFI